MFSNDLHFGILRLKCDTIDEYASDTFHGNVWIVFAKKNVNVGFILE